MVETSVETKTRSRYYIYKEGKQVKLCSLKSLERDYGIIDIKDLMKDKRILHTKDFDVVRLPQNDEHYKLFYRNNQGSYMISNLGYIFHITKAHERIRITNYGKDSSGNIFYMIDNQKFYVAQLVVYHFVYRGKEKFYISYKNNIKEDCTVENLHVEYPERGNKIRFILDDEVRLSFH